jgi:CubicO group peptidase (beta-lactamase class C family)
MTLPDQREELEVEANVPQAQSDQTRLHKPEAGPSLRDRLRTSSTLRWIVIVALLVGVPTSAALILALSQDGAPPALSTSAGTSAAEGECAAWPTETWCTSTPEEQGMDAAVLDQMMQFVDEHGMAIDSVLVVRHGAIVFEEYRNDYDRSTPHHLQSATKSFSSMLIGIAIHEGLIEDVDQKMVDLFPEHTIANMDARKQRITLEHLLTMSDGMDWHELDYPYNDPRNTLGQMWTSGDAVQHVLDRPMARDPGESWAYNSGTSILLGGIIEQVTGRDLLAFAREYLFDPIGIRSVYWQMATGRHYHTDGGLYLTPRDMARFGYLMLRDGTWDGREIVSADWVARSSTAHYQTNGYYGYGYQWWILPDGFGYTATGHYEQRIFVLPEADMVAVFTADIPDDSPYRVDGLLYRFILPACTDLPQEDSSQTYARHGFTFQYPPGFSLLEMPIPGRDALSDASGLVQFNSNWYPPELVSIIWDTPQADVGAEAYVEAFLASLQGESGLEITVGASVDSRKDDHPMVVQFFDATENGLQLAAVTGAWFCDRADRVYIVTYATAAETSQEDLLATFEEHLASLACHPSP